MKYGEIFFVDIFIEISNVIEGKLSRLSSYNQFFI